MRGCDVAPWASLRRLGFTGVGEIVMLSCSGIDCPGPTGVWGGERPWSDAGSLEAAHFIEEGRGLPTIAFDFKEISERGGGEGLPCCSAVCSHGLGVGYDESPPCVAGSYL
jgi:hypothetical protein